MLFPRKSLAGVKAARHFGPFILHNRIGVVRPRILSFFDRIRADPGTSGLPVGAAGFCWGGKFTAVLCNGLIDGKPNTRIDAGFAAHPSQLAIPGDIRNITKPLSVAVGDNDLQLGAAGLDKLKKLLDARTAQAGLKQLVVVYPGAKHGFAVRGDPADEKQKRQGLEAEQQAIAWFSNTLIKAA
jgi:dienelactone hydrolase